MKWKIPAAARWGIGILIFTGFIVLIEQKYGWLPMLSAWGRLDIQDLGIALALIAAGYLLRTLRIFYYFEPAAAGRFSRCLRVMLLHNCLSNLMPMRSGEIAFPVLMQKTFGITAGRSVPALLWFRLLDFLFLFILWGIALQWTNPRPLITGGLFLLAILFLGGLFWLRPRALCWLAQHTGRSARVGQRLVAGIPAQGRTAAHTIVWTVANWSVKLFAYSWLLMKFAAIPFSTALAGAIAGEVSSVFPIQGLAGVGTYEAAIMGMLFAAGTAAHPALQAAANLHLFVLGGSILSAALALALIRPEQKAQSA